MPSVWEVVEPEEAKTKTKLLVENIRDFLFADDCSLNSNTEACMQKNMGLFSTACTNFEFTISTSKTEVLHQPAPGKDYLEPSITVNGQTLKNVDNLNYLDSTHSQSVHIDNEFNTGFAKPSVSFAKLRSNVWDRRGIKLSTIFKVLDACFQFAKLCSAIFFYHF